MSEIERLGKRAFPEQKMADALDRACIAALQTNCRSKVLSMEIYRAVKHAESSNHPITFSDVAKIALEMDAVLVQHSDSEDETSTKRHVLNVVKDQAQSSVNKSEVSKKRCF